MLDGMRKAAQGGVGRVVMAVVMSLIIVSFVIWGIGDMLRGFTSDKVATVGGATVTAQEFGSEFQNTLYQYQRRSKVALTSAQARAVGLDMRVLDRMIDDAAMDQRIASMGMAISDATIAEAARSDPKLKDASGQFSRALFDQALRDSGLTERAFFAKQRSAYLRQQLEYSLIDGLNAPRPLVEALTGAATQTRSIDYFTLAPSAAGDIAAPTPEALKAFFDERKDNYRAPEYRAIDILLVSPAALAKPDSVSDDDARAAYEKQKGERFTTPEKRDVQQIVFQNEADATAALVRIKAGENFVDIAHERKLSDTDMDLGVVAKSDIFDIAIGAAAFQLPEGGVSDVVKGQFGYFLLRAAKVIPESVRPYEEVAAEIKKSVATEHASSDVAAVHDKIEDARVSGKSVVEAAKAAGLQPRTIPAVDVEGLDPNGAPVDLPEKTKLLRAAFASDVGVDDAALNTQDRGYLWFDVAKVEPTHERSLDDVKAKVEAEWRADQVAKALSAKAADLVKQVDGGADLASLAKGVGAEVKTAAGLKRSGGAELPANVVSAVFGLAPGKAGSAATPDGRLVFRITADATPAFSADEPGVKDQSDKLAQGLQEGLVEQFLASLKAQLGVKIDQRVLQAAEGG